MRVKTFQQEDLGKNQKKATEMQCMETWKIKIGIVKTLMTGILVLRKQWKTQMIAPLQFLLKNQQRKIMANTFHHTSEFNVLMITLLREKAGQAVDSTISILKCIENLIHTCTTTQ